MYCILIICLTIQNTRFVYLALRSIFLWIDRPQFHEWRKRWPSWERKLLAKEGRFSIFVPLNNSKTRSLELGREKVDYVQAWKKVKFKKRSKSFFSHLIKKWKTVFHFTGEILQPAVFCSHLSSRVKNILDSEHPNIRGAFFRHPGHELSSS